MRSNQSDRETHHSCGDGQDKSISGRFDNTTFAGAAGSADRAESQLSLPMRRRVGPTKAPTADRGFPLPLDGPLPPGPAPFGPVSPWARPGVWCPKTVRGAFVPDIRIRRGSISSRQMTSVEAFISSSRSSCGFPFWPWNAQTSLKNRWLPAHAMLQLGRGRAEGRGWQKSAPSPWSPRRRGRAMPAGCRGRVCRCAALP